MDVLRRNTDYGMRMMVLLAEFYSDGQLISARQLTSGARFSYMLGSKILQRLHNAGLVNSGMGPKGGFILSKPPSEITLMDVVEALQGNVKLNRCLVDDKGCELQSTCEINTKLSTLQLYIDNYLSGITLAEVIKPNDNT